MYLLIVVFLFCDRNHNCAEPISTSQGKQNTATTNGSVCVTILWTIQNGEDMYCVIKSCNNIFLLNRNKKFVFYPIQTKIQNSHIFPYTNALNVKLNTLDSGSGKEIHVSTLALLNSTSVPGPCCCVLRLSATSVLCCLRLLFVLFSFLLLS